MLPSITKDTDILFLYSACFREYLEKTKYGKSNNKNEQAKYEELLIKIEKVSFILQYNAIKKWKRKPFKQKIYIVNDKIYINFFSELIRIAPNIERSSGRGGFIIDHYAICERNAKKLMQLSNNELNNIIDPILKDKDHQLRKKYFKFMEYNREQSTKKVRFWYYYNRLSLLKTYLVLILQGLYTIWKLFSLITLLFLLVYGILMVIDRQLFLFDLFVIPTDMMIRLIGIIYIPYLFLLGNYLMVFKILSKPTHFEKRKRN